jgi:hypothetical protein
MPGLLAAREGLAGICGAIMVAPTVPTPASHVVELLEKSVYYKRVSPLRNLGLGEAIMSEQELREFKAAMAKLRLENTSSPEKAMQFLKEEGFLDENGEVSKRYAASVAAA